MYLDSSNTADADQGPVVQSIVRFSLVVKILNVLTSRISNSHVFLLKKNVSNLPSLLVVKMLTVLVCPISNSQVFFLKKCEWLLQMQKLLTFFQQKF